MQTREPAVAGTFYPAEPGALRGAVDGYLAAARLLPPPPKCLIAPHAGYVYSGPVAGSAYAQIAPLVGQVSRVVLLGPAHRVPVRGLAAPSSQSFRTPLGDVSIDTAAIESLLDLPTVAVLEAAHDAEHSLEVQLPFLQRTLGEFALVPLVVGEAAAEQVAEVLERLWGGQETLIVISSDLSHYYDYATARQLDETTTRAIETLDVEGLSGESACGRVPIRGALLAARRRGLAVRTLDLRSSGDTAGPRDQVVGYGAYAIG